MGESMKRMRYQKFSRLCKPSSEAVQKTVDKADGGVCQNLVQITQFCDLLLSKTVFIKRKIFESIRRNLEIHKTLLAGPSDCLPAKKGGKASLPVWLTKTWSGVFLKHRAASPPLSQTLSTGQRRPSSASGTPSGGGWCSLSRALWRTFWAVESIKFMQKILKVYLSWRSDQFCWINGKKEPICQELHLQLF